MAIIAASNRIPSQERPGAAATRAEERKTEKYRDLAPNYHFTPLGFETLGNWGDTAISFIKELGSRLASATGEPRSTVFLRQRLSIAIQRGNAAAVRGTVPEGEKMPEIFNLPASY